MKSAIIFLVVVLVAETYALRCLCGPREPDCPPSPPCPGGRVKPPCGCCLSECAKQLGEVCGGSWHFSGRCDKGLFCSKPNGDHWSHKEGVCKHGLALDQFQKVVLLPTFSNKSEEVNYSEAKSLCEGLGADIALIQTEEEMKALVEYVFSRILAVDNDVFGYSLFEDTVMWIGNTYKDGVSNPPYTKWTSSYARLPHATMDYSQVTVSFSYVLQAAGMENRLATYLADGVICQLTRP